MSTSIVRIGDSRLRKDMSNLLEKMAALQTSVEKNMVGMQDKFTATLGAVAEASELTTKITRDSEIEGAYTRWYTSRPLTLKKIF